MRISLSPLFKVSCGVNKCQTERGKKVTCQSYLSHEDFGPIVWCSDLLCKSNI